MKQPNGKFIQGRFWTNIEHNSQGCWLWRGAKNNLGYGCTWYMGQAYVAHRLAWKLWGNVLQSGLELDHLCKNRNCINPNHLEAVTHRENILRGVSPAATHAKKTKCPKGHNFDRTITRKTGKTQRVCSICIKEYAKWYRKKTKFV